MGKDPTGSRPTPSLPKLQGKIKTPLRVKANRGVRHTPMPSARPKGRRV